MKLIRIAGEFGQREDQVACRPPRSSRPDSTEFLKRSSQASDSSGTSRPSRTKAAPMHEYPLRLSVKACTQAKTDSKIGREFDGQPFPSNIPPQKLHACDDTQYHQGCPCQKDGEWAIERTVIACEVTIVNRPPFHCWDS